MKQSSFLVFRALTLAFAALMAALSIWLLLAETARPGANRLPTDQAAAVAAARNRGDAVWAATVGLFRGDLWTEAAYTYSDLLWANPSSASPASDQARRALYQTVRYAPHQAGAWLLFAALSSHFRWTSPSSTEALRMSYYTGPNELPFIPLRLLLLMRLDQLGDSELQEFAQRDLGLLVTHDQKSAVVQAYQSASPAGQRFIEQTLEKADPAFVDSLRKGGSSLALPR